MTKIQISDAKIDSSAVQAELDESAHGAQLVFVGVVRGRNMGRDVCAVAYDAFEPLAKNVLLEICAEAKSRWGEGLRFVIVHRTGKLLVGEASVAIGVSAPHRDEAYQASRYVIEQLKVRVPIWKKEFYTDGETNWLKGHALCGH